MLPPPACMTQAQSPSHNPYKYERMTESVEDFIGLYVLNSDDPVNSNSEKVFVKRDFNKACNCIRRFAVFILIFTTLSLLIFTCLTAFWLSRGKPNYKNHKVIKLMPKSISEFSEIFEIEKNFNIKFWNQPYFEDPTEPIFIQISPGKEEDEIVDRLNQHKLNFTVVIEDLEEAIQEQLKKHQKLDNETNFNFGRFHTYDEITQFLKSIDNPFLKVKSMGKSFEDRDIPVVIISKPKSKQVVVIDSLMHASEWATGSTTLFIINDLLTNKSVDNYLDRFEFHIIPVFNPDGYAYTWTTDRLWRKTRSQSIESVACRGADPNRNFDSNFCKTFGQEEILSPCNEYYCGDYFFSEPEVAAFKDYVTRLNATGKTLEAYFNLHSYRQLWSFPYSYSEKIPKDYQKLQQVSEKATEAIKALYGTTYRYGPAYKLLGPATGVAIDWMYDVLNVKFSFALELRDKENYGHLLSKDMIFPTAEEAWNGIKAVLDLI